LLIGMFIGRNLNDEYVRLPQGVMRNSVPSQMEIRNGRLDINTATKIQLMELPGIGEMIAERIVTYREQNGQYSSIDELKNVEGIGDKKLLQIEAYITVGG